MSDSIVRARWRLPMSSDRFTLDQAKLAELDCRDRLEPSDVEWLWITTPEKLSAFIQSLGAQGW